MGAGPGDARIERARLVSLSLVEAGVHAVALAMVDNAGITRVKCVPISRFEAAARSGVGLSSVFAVFLSNDAITSSPGLEGPSGDLRLVPDPEACVPLAASPGWAWAPVDQFDQEGEPWAACGRTFLKRMTDDLRGRGITMQCALEFEFCLGVEDPGGGEPRPAHVGPGYSAPVLADHADFALDLIQTMEAQGLELQQFHPEYSNGQFEVSVAPRDPLRAADDSLVLRQTVRLVARRYGMRASFAPRVFGVVGNGSHLHFSLWDESGRNIFSGGRGPEGLTEHAEAFAAGLLAELPSLVGVTCPSAVSYQRLQPHRWAGAFTCWGRENREAALRFIAGMVGTRDLASNLEIKPIDATSNPYLAIGSAIAAGVSGLDERLTLPPPTTDDPAGLSEDERSALRIQQLPASLEEAITELEGSSVLRKAMGDFLFDAFLATRRGDLAAYADMDEEEIVRSLRWRY